MEKMDETRKMYVIAFCADGDVTLHECRIKKTEAKRILEERYFDMLKEAETWCKTHNCLGDFYFDMGTYSCNYDSRWFNYSLHEVEFPI